MLRTAFVIVRVNKKALFYLFQYQQKESKRIRNVEIKFNNTVNKTVIEFNHVTHNCFLVP